MTDAPDRLLEVLRCPRSRSRLVRDAASLVCVDPGCRLRFEIKEHIPILLIDEAAELTQAEWGEVMRRHGHDPASGVPGTSSSA
jgi:uncharacterized protein YbaR (Trm112 family)